MVPIVKPHFVEIDYQLPLNVMQRLTTHENIVFLDSAQFDKSLGRYSYIALDPFATMIYHGDDANQPIASPQKPGAIFKTLKSKLLQFRQTTLDGLPPFQGGMAGFMSYDLARDIESLPNQARDDQFHPRLSLGLFDLVISFDNLKKRAWIISTGFPEMQAEKQHARQLARFNWCKEQLDLPMQTTFCADALVDATTIQSNLSRDDYLQRVAKVKDYILAGDIFQANISQRFMTTLPKTMTPWALYQRLRCVNPAPFAAFVNIGDSAVVSSSPERFIQCIARQVETRPIKGTMRRALDAAEDQQLASQLLASAKDRAENTMIVDLMRNDLSKVCFPHTVKVPKLCGLETYQTVHHLVSVVTGELAPEHDVIDLLLATFPGGSVTGAPKIRAMQIIDELEPTERGPYCGCAGFIGFDGSMDTSILIRSFVVKNHIATYQVGGAIVLNSEPEQEYQETLTKALGLHRALTDDLPMLETEAL